MVPPTMGYLPVQPGRCWTSAFFSILPQKIQCHWLTIKIFVTKLLICITRSDSSRVSGSSGLHIEPDFNERRHSESVVKSRNSQLGKNQNQNFASYNNCLSSRLCKSTQMTVVFWFVHQHLPLFLPPLISCRVVNYLLDGSLSQETKSFFLFSKAVMTKQTNKQEI